MKATIEKMLCLAAGLTIATMASAAQPDVPQQIKIVVPFSAGASNDAIARTIAPQLAARLKTTVIVENRSGAAGVIGSDYVARAPKDGSVLLLTSSTFLTSAATQPTLPYDPIRQFAPVSMIGQGPLVIAVSGQTPYQSLSQLIDAAKAKPGVLNYGTAGIGSLAHLATVMLEDASAAKMTHVPYKGAANASSDLAGGQIDVMLSNYSTLAPVVQNQKVRLLATTSAAPHPSFPDLSPAAATLSGYTVDIWVGVFAPSGTPQAYVDRLNAELNEISASTETKRLLDLDGTVPMALSSAAFAKRANDDLTTWKSVAQKHNITAN